MSTFVMIHHFSSQEIFWLKQSGVWWILVAFAGALALVFLYLYFKWKKYLSFLQVSLMWKKRRVVVIRFIT